jgi:Plasmid pRiA4b ORF-3-like protein
MTASPSIARIKVVLDHVEPVVIRRFEVPLSLRLDRLHTVLQTVMGWTDSHLYEFWIKGIRFGIPDPDWGFRNGPLDARKATLLDILEDTGARSFKYLYDFGDGWEHSVKIEKITPALSGVVYPQLLDASGCCPPEDIGGPPGYQEAREALADPNHERHTEIVEWWGPRSHDLDTIDTTLIDTELSALARRWYRKPRAKA